MKIEDRTISLQKLAVEVCEKCTVTFTDDEVLEILEGFKEHADPIVNKKKVLLLLKLASKTNTVELNSVELKFLINCTTDKLKMELTNVLYTL